MTLLTRVKSAVLFGLRGLIVEVEVDISNGLPSFDIVGLPDAAVRESKERVRAAIRNSGLEFPLRRITVNLTPGDLRKEGSHLDLPIAVGVLAAAGQVPLARAGGMAVFGALSLGGGIRPTSGALPLVLIAREAGLRGVIVPEANGPEARLVDGIEVVSAGNLTWFVSWLRGLECPSPADGERFDKIENGLSDPHRSGVLQGGGDAIPDLSEVLGQGAAKDALEVAAAGGHNVLLVGPPGAGKTMLARCFPGILPPLIPAEALEVTAIYSAAGLLPPGYGLVERRFVRAPHHSASMAALVGGGANPRPGEVTLAHHGVLFLDEVAEFARDALEALRQPVEDGNVCISRARGAVTYPARFVLVAASNPCPCGYYGDPERACTCTPWQVIKYRSRISGPLLDRIDLHVSVGRVPFSDLRQTASGETSSIVRGRVLAARERQSHRFRGTAVNCNARMGRTLIQRHCRLDDAAGKVLRLYLEGTGASARGYDRILRVARTLADLDGSEMIRERHLSQACYLRELDRDFARLKNGPPSGRGS